MVGRMKKYLFIIVLALLVASLALNVFVMSRNPKVERSEKVVVRKDTVKVVEPKMVSQKPVEIVVVSSRKMSEGEPMPEVQVCDSDTIVRVPIQQNVYSDSNYVAYVSGYRAKLDSIMIINTERTRTIREVMKEEKPPNRWKVGFMAGYGVGLLDRKPQPFIGVGVTFALF